MWDVSERFHKASNSSHEVLLRVEVWSLGQQIDELFPGQFIGGDVRDVRVTGIRRSLSLEVPQNKDWLRWLALPALEIRPYRGIRFGLNDDEWCPLGRFGIKNRPRSLRPKTLTLSGNDHWQRVQDQSFTGPRAVGAMGWLIRDMIAQLIRETGQDAEPDVRGVTSLAVSPEVLWEEPSRHNAIADMCKAIAAEAFIDRDGTPIERDWYRALVPAVTLRGVIDIEADDDWGYVYNSVSVTSTVSGVSFDPQVASIDWDHPANRSNLGGDVILAIKSNLVTTPEQALIMAGTEAWKHSQPAKQVTVKQVPNAALDAGDVVGLEWEDPIVQIKSINHPLTLEGVQSATMTSAVDYG